MRAILAALGVLALAASASAATLKVPQQYGTIQEAVNAASEGDTIVVAKGVYYEAVGVFTPNLRILGKKAVIDGTFAGGDALTVLAPGISYYSILSVYAPGVTIQGFTFRNGSTQVNLYAPDCKVLKCVFRNASGHGIYVGGHSGTEIAGNRIVGAGSSGIYVSGSSTASGVITGNTIQQVYDFGIQMNGNGASIEGNRISTVASNMGIYVNGSSAVVDGNTVSNTAGNGIGLYGSDFTVTGNRVSWASGDTGIYVSGDRSLIQGNTVTAAASLLTAYGSGSSILDNRVSVALYGG